MRIDQQFEIGRPVADVFAYVTDPEKLPEWQDTAISATNETGGPLRAGTRLREVRRAPFGKRVEQIVEVATYEPERAFALRIVDGPLKVDGAYRFEGHGDHTHVDFTADGDVGGALKLVAPLVRRTLARQFAGYHRCLKEKLETRS
jgi:carbon monoxide dehydrogenase subunit G